MNQGTCFRKTAYFLEKKKQTDLLSEDFFRVHYGIFHVAKISASQKAPLISPNLFSGRKEHCMRVLEIGSVGSVFYFEWSRGS